MSSFAMLAFFAAFGCVCGFYVSVVGFTVTSLAVALLLGLTNPLFAGPFTLGFLVLAVIAQQTGYGLTVVGQGFVQRRQSFARPDAPHRESERDREPLEPRGKAPGGPLPR
ncbi:hypothetical protein [Methylobacterium gossipiicola]|nr:hypothetical protein [Methylobacterium gossipiicola]